MSPTSCSSRTSRAPSTCCATTPTSTRVRPPSRRRRSRCSRCRRRSRATFARSPRCSSWRRRSSARPTCAATSARRHAGSTATTSIPKLRGLIQKMSDQAQQEYKEAVEAYIADRRRPVGGVARHGRPARRHPSPVHRARSSRATPAARSTSRSPCSWRSSPASTSGSAITPSTSPTASGYIATGVLPEHEAAPRSRDLERHRQGVARSEPNDAIFWSPSWRSPSRSRMVGRSADLSRRTGRSRRTATTSTAALSLADVLERPSDRRRDRRPGRSRRVPQRGRAPADRHPQPAC